MACKGTTRKPRGELIEQITLVHASGTGAVAKSMGPRTAEFMKPNSQLRATATTGITGGSATRCHLQVARATDQALQKKE